MSLKRPDKLKYKRRRIQGDRKLETVSKVSQESSLSTLERVESIYDDDVKLSLLEGAEKALSLFEDNVSEALDNLNILISPSHTQLIRAISMLQGEASLVLDGKTIEKAVDLSMDSFIHSNGFDPVAAALGLHGDTDGIPNAPIPKMLQDCNAMQNLDNIPSIYDEDYKTKPIDDLSVEVSETNSFDLIGKLWRILKYFPGLDIVSFLEFLKIKPIVKIIQKAIDWVKCSMIYPALFLLTGEAKSCTEEDSDTITSNPKDDSFVRAEHMEGKGLDCLEAAAVVISYCELKLRDNKDIRNLFLAKEERAEQEALKFGMLSNSITNKAHFADRIDSLYEKTKSIPRYRKRYYDNKDTFSGIKKYQMLSLEEYEKQTEGV